MKYYMDTCIKTDFDSAVSLVKKSLEQYGFGVVSEIDIKDKLRENLGVEFRKYKIIGVCNPQFAYKALQYEDKIGVMLPCNIIVQEKENEIEIAAVDPSRSMSTIANYELGLIALELKQDLLKIIESLN